MPVRVIDILEVVYVEHQEPGGTLETSCALQLTAQRLQDLAPRFQTPVSESCVA